MVTQSNKQAHLNGQPPKNELSGTATSKSDNSVKFNEKPWVVLLGTIGTPLVVALLGFIFTANQTTLANQRQDADSADKAIEIREQVLTDYGKSVTDLLGKSNSNGQGNPDVEKMIRGQTLIALRRLNVAEADESQDAENAKVTSNLLNLDWNPFSTKEQSQVSKDKEAESKLEAGNLKGMLIRYLYETHLLGYSYSPETPARVSLSGADVNDVVLEDAWLYGIQLRGAWLKNGNFKNANLTSADFTGANLTGADFTRTDLRFANLKFANLSTAILSGACYVAGTEATYFPDGFDPVEAGMVAIAEDESNPTAPNFKPCSE
jgi:uncharacterized protein YjbI with pentapeptide repeats